MGDSFLGHMPWKTMDQQEQRYDMVREMRSGALSVSEVCRRWHISRKTAYKWQQRYRQERLKGLADRSQRRARMTGRTSAHWLERLRRLRRRHSTWGARKLKHRLGQEFGKGGLPGVATLGRWLKRWGMAAGGQRRKPGPVILRRVVREARHCNDVWTVDFKGWYRTGDGTRVDPLTVRDLYSRYGLRVRTFAQHAGGAGTAGVCQNLQGIWVAQAHPQRQRDTLWRRWADRPDTIERVVGEAGD